MLTCQSLTEIYKVLYEGNTVNDAFKGLTQI